MLENTPIETLRPGNPPTNLVESIKPKDGGASTLKLKPEVTPKPNPWNRKWQKNPSKTPEFM